MQLQRQTVSRLGQLRDRVRSTLAADADGAASTAGEDEPEAEDDAPDSGESPFGNLFHCSTCGVVYIDTEKRVCSECESEVEQVRSTLACQ